MSEDTLYVDIDNILESLREKVSSLSEESQRSQYIKNIKLLDDIKLKMRDSGILNTSVVLSKPLDADTQILFDDLRKRIEEVKQAEKGVVFPSEDSEDSKEAEKDSDGETDIEDESIIDRMNTLDKKVDDLSTLVNKIESQLKIQYGIDYSKVLSSTLNYSQQLLLNNARDIVGHITLRGIPHKIVIHKFKGLKEYIAGRYSNLEPGDVIPKISILTQEDPLNRGTLQDEQGLINTYSTQNDTSTNKDVNLISILPTSTAGGNKAMYRMLMDIHKEVVSGEYRHHSVETEGISLVQKKEPNTYEFYKNSGKKDSKGKIIYINPHYMNISTVEKSLIHLSMEYMEAMYAYLMKTYKTTGGYFMMLPTTLANMKIPTTLFQMELDTYGSDIAKSPLHNLINGFRSDSPPTDKLPPYVSFCIEKTKLITLPKLTVSSLGAKTLRKTVTNESDLYIQLSQLYIQLTKSEESSASPSFGLQDFLSKHGDANVMKYIINTSVNVLVRDTYQKEETVVKQPSSAIRDIFSKIRKSQEDTLQTQKARNVAIDTLKKLSENKITTP